MAGSNHHRRTLDFQGVEEIDARNTPVHILIVWNADGSIQAYRNGLPYGERYRKNELVAFEKGDSQLLFGLRHASPAGNRLLTGRILDAKLYNRALTEVEAAAAAGVKLTVTEQDVREALDGSARQRLGILDASLKQAQADLDAFGDPAADHQVWTDLAHALFNLKEFIFLQ